MQVKNFANGIDIRFFTMGTCFLEAAICTVLDQQDMSEVSIDIESERRDVLCRWAMMVVIRRWSIEVLQASRKISAVRKSQAR